MDFDQPRPEKRSVALTDLEMNATGTRFEGYAAIFGQEADLGDFTEEVRRGAFRKVLAQETNVPMYWDHDPRIPPLATTRSGTLRLEEDVRGLRVEADLDDDHYLTPTLRSMIRRGDVTGMSFGFIAGAGNSKIENRNGKPHRVLVGFSHVLDVSPTWEPAYAGTSAELRSQLGMLRAADHIDTGQQILSGAYQQLGDGAPVETRNADTGEVAEEVPPAVTQDEDQRSSGVDEAALAEFAARKRRLHLLGLTLPKGDLL